MTTHHGAIGQAEATQLLEAARITERRARLKADSADAKMADAIARGVDADAQTRHAKTGIDAAEAHMRAARIHMQAADLRERDAHELEDHADQLMVAAASLLEEAVDDSAEYQRALYHYTQLVRHRMANPIQTICGMVGTLIELPELDVEQRQEMLAAVLDQARVLERVCLDPRIMDEVERELLPRPFQGE